MIQRCKKGGINMAYSNPIPELEELLDNIGEENEADYVQMKEVYF